MTSSATSGLWWPLVVSLLVTGFVYGGKSVRAGEVSCAALASLGVVAMTVTHTRRSAELRALRAREARHAAVIATLTGGVIVRDHAGVLLDVNPAALALTGLSCEQLQHAHDSASPVGSWAIVQADGTPVAAAQRLALVGLCLSPLHHTLLGVRRDAGSPAWLLVNVEIVRHASRGVSGSVVTSLMDVTEHVDAGRRLPILPPHPVRDVDDAIRQGTSASTLVPICMHCKSIRNDTGGWEHFEDYFAARTRLLFSHGICPDCATVHYPGACD